MSTVLYGGRVPRKRFWDFVLNVRLYYLDNHPIYKAFNESPKKYYDLLLKEEKSLLIDESVELQVFEESQRTYFIRPLENGYFFTNHLDKFPHFTEAYYDGRVGERKNLNEKQVDRIDSMIASGIYFICNLISTEVVARDAMVRDFKRKTLVPPTT